jgi:hypothetical protein
MTEEPQSREYQALDPKDKTRRRSVELRMKDGRRYWLKYADRHLMALRPDHTELAVFFYSMSIVITGQNLAEAATAIDGENVAWLQEFDPKRWDRPTDSAAMVIEAIELYQPKPGKDAGSDAPAVPGLDGTPATPKH